MSFTVAFVNSMLPCRSKSTNQKSLTNPRVLNGGVNGRVNGVCLWTTGLALWAELKQKPSRHI